MTDTVRTLGYSRSGAAPGKRPCPWHDCDAMSSRWTSAPAWPPSPGGSLGIVSTHHIAGGTNAFFADAQRCCERFDPTPPPGVRLTTDDETPEEAAEFDRSARFGPVEFRRYGWQQTYTAPEYLNLLTTYSGNRAMAPRARNGLFACIAHLIDEVYGGAITKQFRTRLAIAHKTS